MATRTLSPLAREATRLLGERIRLARRERRWTIEELAERVGVSHVTISKVERGDPGVALGTAFEAAALLGIPLFDQDPARRRGELLRIQDQIVVMPRPTRRRPVDNDF